MVLDIDGNLYEIPNLNYILSVNILSGLGVNTRTLTMSEVISNSGSCRIDLAGNWMHKVNGIEIRGCPFNSISKKMFEINWLVLSHQKKVCKKLPAQKKMFEIFLLFWSYISVIF